MDSEETLAARILAEEHHALPTALNLLTQGRLRVTGRHVELIGDQETLSPSGNYLHPRSLEILVATGNQHKLHEIGQILREFPIIFRGTHEFDGVTEPDESAPDYLGNARIKAQAWGNHTGMWALADDSGLEVDALDGRPGVKSARYAPSEKERIVKLLAELEGVPEEKRTARFVCAVVLVGPNGEEHHAVGTCEGRIAFEARGDKGFGYDPVFIPDGFSGRHLAELSEATKNNISHRARALYALKPVLTKLLRMGDLA
jgi:XTP/dITP diphosphohydrolase